MVQALHCLICYYLLQACWSNPKISESKRHNIPCRMDRANQSLTVMYGNTLSAGKGGRRTIRLSAINTQTQHEVCVALPCFVILELDIVNM